MFNKDIKETIKMCRYCYMCRHACPTFLATKLDSHTPRGYALTLSLIDEGHIDWDEEGLERLFHCSQCGLCKELCEFSWPEDEMVLEGRKEMIKAAKQPERIIEAVETIEKEGVKLNKSIDTSKCDNRDADILLIAGSALLNMHEKTISDALSIFENQKINYTMMKEEDVSGPILYELGYTEQADSWKASMAEKIKKLNPKKVVTLCAHTYTMLDNELSENGIVHFVDFMAGLFGQNKLNIDTNRDKEKVMYHDPCNIGRKKGIYDAPRMILDSLGYQVEEFHHCKNEAECCGAGACVDIVYPEVSNKVAVKRLEQAIEKGINTVITACPNCKKAFDGACESQDLNIKVFDIASVVCKHLK